MIILSAPRMATGTEMRQKLGWRTLAQRRKVHCLKMAHRCLHNIGPTYLHHKFRYDSNVSGTWGSYSGKLYLSRPRTEFYRKCFEYSTGKLWNSLLSKIRGLGSLVSFTNAHRHILHFFLNLFEYICTLHALSFLFSCFFVAFLFGRCTYARLTWKSAIESELTTC